MWEEYAKIPNASYDIYYCAQIESDRKWQVPEARGIKEFFLKGLSIGKSKHLNLGILKIFKKYDLWIVGGYSIPSAQLLIILCKLFRIPYVIMFDGISPVKIHKKENWLKFTWKKFLVHGCTAWLGNGTVGKIYGKKLGITGTKIYNQFLTVDIDRFKELSKRKQEIRLKIRKKLSIPIDAFVILYTGRLVKHKGVQDLIEIFEEISSVESNIYLLIVGHGIYENILKEKSESYNNIHFKGNVEYQKIHEMYLCADLFVLPTYNDPWGLVINEALACELPVITTEAAGASVDLVNNKLIYNHGNTVQLKKIITSFLFNKEDNRIYVQDEFERIKNFNFSNSRVELKKIISTLNK
ncbi:MAG: glycosyltransferase family 4 protein [Kosmotoga sp.]|nr:MAG: glycosyltransferase family 4 protein [Kosmotoga sp.]